MYMNGSWFLYRRP